ncbi:MAG: HAMP domain-containing histidine kinase [Bdellovibrionales bacterium]|nr:HAMP domain-containing histidine kinase [Bdellovibrionales bacterium]
MVRAAKKKIARVKAPRKMTTHERKALVAERLRFDSLRVKSAESAPAFDAALFVAGVAHEFNNILGAADGHAEWGLDSGKPEDMREALHTVRLACKRSAEITQGLQGLFQPREESKVVFELADLIGELERMFRPTCQKLGVTLALPKKSASLYGDPVRVLEILVNLVKNSVEACGGAARRGKVQIEAQATKGWLTVQVTDNGPGIPPAFRDLLFQPFFTTKGAFGNALPVQPAPNRTVGAGTGLGLFLSRQIAVEHGGTLENLALASGTRFELRLPLAT